jgi:hypothetical protein
LKIIINILKIFCGFYSQHKFCKFTASSFLAQPFQQVPPVHSAHARVGTIHRPTDEIPSYEEASGALGLGQVNDVDGYITIKYPYCMYQYI